MACCGMSVYSKMHVHELTLGGAFISISKCLQCFYVAEGARATSQAQEQGAVLRDDPGNPKVIDYF